MASAALLAVLSMRARGAADWYMPLGLYVSLAAFLRGYFFAYYHGNALSRVTTLLIFLLGTLLSGALWEERAPAREVLRASGIFNVSEAPGFHFAAILHLAAASTILIHFILPRHWLIQMTDQVVETAGLERSLEDDNARRQASRAPRPLEAEAASPDDERSSTRHTHKMCTCRTIVGYVHADYRRGLQYLHSTSSVDFDHAPHAQRSGVFSDL